MRVCIIAGIYDLPGEFFGMSATYRHGRVLVFALHNYGANRIVLGTWHCGDKKVRVDVEHQDPIGTYTPTNIKITMLQQASLLRSSWCTLKHANRAPTVIPPRLTDTYACCPRARHVKILLESECVLIPARRSLYGVLWNLVL